MATIDNTLTFRNYPVVRLTQTYEASSLAASDVVKMITVKKDFRVTRVQLKFDDLGTGTTADVGYLGNSTEGVTGDADYFIDGQDTATAAGTATWEPADSEGKLFTADDVITFTNLGAAATGSIRIDVDGYFDFS